MTSIHNAPRTPLAILPTPIHKLERLSAYFGGPAIWMKRDDLTGGANDRSGNKTRNLEFLMGEALAENATLIMTEGNIQSNNARQTSAVASLLRKKCAILLKGEPQPVETCSGNALLDVYHGADVTFARDNDEMGVKRAEILEKLQKQGEKIYRVPTGSSNEVGALGYVFAVEEIMSQEKAMGLSFSHIIHTCSSGGTQSGLILGKDVFGLKAEIHSAINDDINLSLGCTPAEAVKIIIERARSKYNIKPAKGTPNHEYPEYAENGYGNPTDRDLHAMALFLATESIVIDPVYLCRSAAFLVDAMKAGRFKKGENVLFLHTGGHASLHSDRYRREVYPDVTRRAQTIRQELRGT